MKNLHLAFVICSMFGVAAGGAMAQEVENDEGETVYMNQIYIERQGKDPINIDNIDPSAAVEVSVKDELGEEKLHVYQQGGSNRVELWHEDEKNHVRVNQQGSRNRIIIRQR